MLYNVDSCRCFGGLRVDTTTCFLTLVIRYKSKNKAVTALLVSTVTILRLPDSKITIKERKAVYFHKCSNMVHFISLLKDK